MQTAGPGRRSHHNTTGGQLGPVGWGRVAGFVAIAPEPMGYMKKFQASTGKPVVSIGHAEAGSSSSSVIVDNRGGVRQAVEHLLGHGHTRIGFVGCLELFDMRERYESYLGTLRANGVEPDPGLFFEAVDSLEQGGLSAAQAMLEAGLPATAVVVATDLNAIGLMRSLKAAGLSLPQDLAVVGFDDMPGCGLQSPSLSSVSQDLDQLGTRAVDLMMRLVRAEWPGQENLVLPACFIARESCGCAGEDGASAARGAAATEDPLAVFLRSVGQSAPGPLAAGAEAGAGGGPAAALAEEVARTFQAAADRELSPIELLGLGRVCVALYDQYPGRATTDAVLVLAAQLSASLRRQRGRDDELVARLDQCLAQVRLTLAKAPFLERNDAYYSLRKATRDEYEITLDLMSRDGDPANLKWLGRTGALMGVLALWRRPGQGVPGDGGPGRDSGRDDAFRDGDQPPAQGPGPGWELEVTGTFVAPGHQPDLPWSTPPVPPTSPAPAAPLMPVSPYACPVELFPPAEFFDAAGTGSFVSIFPVKSVSTDWGFLAVAGPISSGLVGQDLVFMWSAVFSEALDHRALTRSLSQRSEDLARSYEREKEMAQAVRESEERYALAAKAANDGLWDWDLARGTVYYSPRWKEMLGYAAADIGEEPEEWLLRVHPDDRVALSAALEGLRNGQQPSLINEHRVRAGDGDYKWALCRALAVPGAGEPATRIVGSLTDVTERHLLEERLRHQALFDSLTGLPNRVLFMDRLSQAVANARRHPSFAYTVIWLDLDNFKNLNDSLGHQFGDKLLVQVADRIRAQLRGPDTAARFGGDEFALLVLDVPDFTSVQGIVKRLLDSLLAPYQLDGHEVVVTGSLGVATSATGYDSPEDVLRDADIAMYRAKSTARGSYATFDRSMYAAAVARHQTETELRQAIESSVKRARGPRIFPTFHHEGTVRGRRRPGRGHTWPHLRRRCPRQLLGAALPARGRPRYGGRRRARSTRSVAPPHTRFGAGL